MIIKVEMRSVYGSQTIYPICDKAKIFASLVGQKTLTYGDIAKIKALGYDVEVVQDVVKL